MDNSYISWHKSIVKQEDGAMYLIKTVKGNITKITYVQTIVNVANNYLLKGGVIIWHSIYL